MNFTTQCGENRHTNLANFATLIHTKKLIHCVAIFTILYDYYYPPHGKFKLICIGKFARRAWVNFTQQYGKNRQRCQQNTFYYAAWQLLLYFNREFPSKILSVYTEGILLVVLTKRPQLYIFSKRYQKFCKTYQYLKLDGTKYGSKFVKLIKFK